MIYVHSLHDGLPFCYRVERVTAAEQLTPPGVHLIQRRFGLGFNPSLDVPPRRRGELPCTANNPTPGQPRNAARILGQALHRCLARPAWFISWLTRRTAETPPRLPIRFQKSMNPAPRPLTTSGTSTPSPERMPMIRS